ncbi:MAG: amino acid adenylation domain-containing protein, partial [bacterium]|nr:amino acid adenylation domain-containing protein [bacterium]
SDIIRINITYAVTLFEEKTILRLIGYFKKIIKTALTNPETKIAAIEIIPETVKHAILARFNRNLEDETINRPLQDKLNQKFDAHREAVALRQGASEYTYGELQKRAASITAWITGSRYPKGTYIGIYMEDRIEVITAMIGILNAGSVFVPMDTALPLKRIQTMVQITGTGIIFTDEQNEAKLTGIINSTFHSTNQPTPSIMSIKSIPSFTSTKSTVTYGLDDHIYVYFTSGTTGTPKAIIGKNKSLLQFIQWEIDTFAITQNSRISQLTSLGFDALLRDVFSTLCAGGTICIPESQELISDSEKLITWIDKKEITVIHCVPGIFKIFNTPRLTSRNFSNLKYILLSGEALPPYELINWQDKTGERIQLVNLYGPTETTMIRTIYPITAADRHKNSIPIGKPIKGTEIILLDKAMNVCDRGQVGEIVIRTPYTTAGYCNDPQITGEKFIPNPYRQKKDDVLYKTGDLARKTGDGNLQLLGRKDRQIKIRGVRIELSEIETALTTHTRVKEAAALLKQNKNGEKYLCVYYAEHPPQHHATGTQHPTPREHLAQTIPPYMLPENLVKIAGIPLTPNGKIDRKTLAQYPVTNQQTQRHTPPRDELEKKLVEIWAETLNIEKETIRIEDDFFHMGGQSLKATVLAAKIHKELNIKLPLTEIFLNPTIETLAKTIKTKTTAMTPGVTAAQEGDGTFAAIEPAEKKEYYPLSSPQKRLYILQQMELESTAYNMPHTHTIAAGTDIERLEETFKQLIQRHESLRTSFHMQLTTTPTNQSPITNTQPSPVQVIHETVPFRFQCYSLKREQTGDPLKRVKHEFFRPFDLNRAPLIRVAIVGEIAAAGEEKGKLLQDGYMLLDMHHIITDGTSQGVLEKEYRAQYAGETLPCLKLQYRDYACWQNAAKQKQLMKQQEQYWLRHYSAEIPRLTLPTDYPRPTIQSYEGKKETIQLKRETAASLEEAARESKTTLYMKMLEIYTILLSRLSGQEEIVVGTPTAGRRHAQLENIIGMFVNTLAIRNKPEGEKSSREYLKEVKKQTLEAFENQEYPFEELVEKLAVTRDPGRNPLFDVMLSYQEATANRSHKEEPTINTKFDLILDLQQTGENLNLTLEYCTKLFKKETIQRYTGYLKNIIKAILANPETKLKEIDILSKEEKKRILIDFNNTAADYPETKTIHQLVEEQAEQAPHRIVAVGDAAPNAGKIHESTLSTTSTTSFPSFSSTPSTNKSPSSIQLTNRELNQRAAQQAAQLQKKGLAPGDIAALALPPSIETLIVIIAIWKAGAAYLPIDPEYPQERINYILKDSNAKILLKKSYELNELHELHELHELKEFRELKAATPTDPVSGLRPPATSQAYIIYTSGTTGKPKGVVVPHTSFVNRLSWLQRRYGLGAGDVFIQKTPLTFDVSVCEMFRWISGGGRVILLKPGGERDPEVMVEAVARHGATTIDFVPSMLNEFLEYIQTNNAMPAVATLRWVFVGVEPLRMELVEKYNRTINKHTGARLINAYGPTEATIDITAYDCSQTGTQTGDIPEGNHEKVPIGRPIQNTQIVILDKHGNIQP